MVSLDGWKYSSNCTFTLSLELQESHRPVNLWFFSCCFAVYADGSICLDILQNRWSPTYDVSSILTSIQVIEDL